MLWNPAGEQGTIVIDKGFLVQVKSFLKKKEKYFAIALVKAFREIEKRVSVVADVTQETLPTTLKESLLVVRDKIETIVQGKSESIPFEEWKAAVAHLNQACWNYVEVLESYVVEFHHQLEQTHLDLVDAKVLDVVQ